MTHEVIKHLLDDYVTGDLTEEARAPVAEHIATCDLCRSETESLQTIAARARELPRSVEPPAEAWAGIRSAIARDESAVRGSVSAASFGERRRLYLAAAAVVLAAVLSSAGTAWYLSARNSAGNLPAATAASNNAETPATLAAFTIEENNYLRTASRLQDLLDQQEGSLAPETVAQLRSEPACDRRRDHRGAKRARA